MGHREYFIYMTGKGSIENLLERLSKHFKINSDNIEEPTIMVYCKAEVLKDFTNGIDGLEKGTVGAIISPEDISTDELNNVLEGIEKPGFGIFELFALPEDYDKLFKDSEIKIGDKTYFSR